jgi:hypothetical protein
VPHFRCCSSCWMKHAEQGPNRFTRPTKETSLPHPSGSTPMFNRQTLFVLGAGASHEAGLPLGKDLARAIGGKMDIRFELGNKQIGTGDMDLYVQITNQMRNNVHEYQTASWLIRDGIGFTQSIDDFLDQHRFDHYVNLYGKVAIVKAILEAERQSKLYFGGTSGRESFHPDQFADTWFVKFMYMLGRGIPKENVRQIFDRVSFIIFNYDRCVEHFLLHALQKTYGIRADEASSILSDLHLIHPYGVVDDSIPFGSVRGNYVSLADGIKTYTEQIGSADIIGQVAAEVQRAECIVFLGFAYHSQNMLIIRPHNSMPTKPVFGTAFGMSDSDREVVSHQIDAWFAAHDNRAYRSTMIKLENKLTCGALFDEYAKSLTGGD